MTQQLSLFDFEENSSNISEQETINAYQNSNQKTSESALRAVKPPLAELSFTFFIAPFIEPRKEEATIEFVETAHKIQSPISYLEEVVHYPEEKPDKKLKDIEDGNILVNTEKNSSIFTSDDGIKSTRKRGRKSFKEIDIEVDLIEVPEDEELFSKQYYSISEVAKWFRVNNSLLRFWENEFSILKPRKNKKGDRLFRPEDVKNLQVIYYLLRQRKFTIDGARKYMKVHKENIEMNLKLIQTLNKFKSFLLELKANVQD